MARAKNPVVAKNLPLARAVQASASKARIAASWVSSKAPLAVADSFLLEMHLLVEVIERLSKGYVIDYVAGTGKTPDEFPRSPALKAGKPKFTAKDAKTNAVKYQVCAGTQVEDKHKSARGVDVSLQRGSASDKPTGADLIRIFDAKYRENPKDRITHPERSEFAKWIEWFALRAPAPGEALLGDLDGHCLVSNGKHSTEPLSILREDNMAEIEDFFPGKTPKARR